MKAKILAGNLKNLTGIMSTIKDEILIMVSEKHIEIRETDEKNKMLMIMKIDEGIFEKYAATKSTIGMNIKRLDKTLTAIENNKMLDLEIDEESRIMHIRIGHMQYDLKLIDPKVLTMPSKVPDIDTTSSIILETSKFRRAIDNAEKVGDRVNICNKNNVFWIETRSKDEITRSENEIMRHMFILPKRTVLSRKSQSKKSKAVFSVNYLRKITKNFGRSKFVDIVLEDGILKISFKVHNAQVEYYLAAES